MDAQRSILGLLTPTSTPDGALVHHNQATDDDPNVGQNVPVTLSVTSSTRVSTLLQNGSRLTGDGGLHSGWFQASTHARAP